MEGVGLNELIYVLIGYGPRFSKHTTPTLIHFLNFKGEHLSEEILQSLQPEL